MESSFISGNGTRSNGLALILVGISLSLGGCAAQKYGSNSKNLISNTGSNSTSGGSESRFSIQSLQVGFTETQKQFSFTFGDDIRSIGYVTHSCQGATLSIGGVSIRSFDDFSSGHPVIAVDASAGETLSIEMNFASSNRKQCSVLVEDEEGDNWKELAVQFAAPAECSSILADWSDPSFKCCAGQSMCIGGVSPVCFATDAVESQACRL